jgi:hypothetical protein
MHEWLACIPCRLIVSRDPPPHFLHASRLAHACWLAGRGVGRHGQRAHDVQGASCGAGAQAW